MTEITIVGPKGEIAIPLEFRKQLAIQPGSNLSIRVVDNKLVLEKIPSPIELLNKEKLYKVRLSDLEASTKELQNHWMGEDPS